MNLNGGINKVVTIDVASKDVDIAHYYLNNEIHSREIG